MSDDLAAALRQADDLQAQGRLDQAAATLDGVLAAAPDHPRALAMRGTLHLRCGEGAAGAAALDRACRLDPGLTQARYNLATWRLQQGEAASALEGLDRVSAAEPDFALAHVNRGVALLALDRGSEGVGAFRTALALQPTLIDAHRALAFALAAAGREAELPAALQAWLDAVPSGREVDADLGRACLAAAARAEVGGRLHEAEALCEGAARAADTRGEALTGLSNLLEARGAFEAAHAAAAQAVRLRPDLPAAHNNLGLAHLRLGRAEAAETAYRNAIARAPDHVQAHHGLAFALLKQERFAEAWPEYAWRLALPAARAATARLGGRPWAGEAMPGGSLLLVGEQGLGDVLQAVRFASLIRDRVAEIIVQAPRPLVGLLRTMRSNDRVVADDLPTPAHDAWLPMMSLFGLTGVTPEFQPDGLERLAPRPEKVAAWAGRLPPGRWRVGVAWQGNPDVRVEHGRSFPLAALSPLAQAGATLISLQKGFGVEQLETDPGFPVCDLGPAYRDGDFEDTAAVIAGLDLVVCCDTSVGHLAGAIGRPAWIVLGDNPDWRWLRTREDSLWYETVRVARRRATEPWSETLARLARQALAERP